MNEKKIDTFWLIIKFLLISGGLVFILKGFIFIPLMVEGNSMEDTLHQEDYIVMEKFSDIHRFDIVVFQLQDGSTYIKRVIGLPGESIRYEQDQLYVDKTPVSEDFLDKSEFSQSSPVTYTTDFELKEITDEDKLAKDEYFVLGDNRRLSKDSRSFGSIKKEYIIGKARLVYYPFRHFKIL